MRSSPTAPDTDDELTVPITVGLVTWRTPQNLEDLFVEADALMYNAKRNAGGDRFESQVIG